MKKIYNFLFLSSMHLNNVFFLELNHLSNHKRSVLINISQTYSIFLWSDASFHNLKDAQIFSFLVFAWLPFITLHFKLPNTFEKNIPVLYCNFPKDKLEIYYVIIHVTTADGFFSFYLIASAFWHTSKTSLPIILINRKGEKRGYRHAVFFSVINKSGALSSIT